MAALASTQFTGLSGVTLIQQEAKPAYSAGTTWYLKLQVSPGSLSFYKYDDAGFSSGQTAIFSNVAIDDSVGSGYGPFGSFISHNCSVISTSSFEYFTLKISPEHRARYHRARCGHEPRRSVRTPSPTSVQPTPEDGDLSGKVQITSNNVNADVPGVYQVVYSVADILGLTGTHTRTVTVRADVELMAVDAVTGNPLSGVGFSLDDENLPDTSADGKTAAVIDPGTHAWEVVKAPPRLHFPQGRIGSDGRQQIQYMARSDPHSLREEDLRYGACRTAYQGQRHSCDGGHHSQVWRYRRLSASYHQ